MKQKTFKKIYKLLKPSKRAITLVILSCFVLGSIIAPPAKSAKAVDIGINNPIPGLPDPSVTIPRTGGGGSSDSSGSSSTSRTASGSSKYFKSVNWSQIDSVNDARRFFGVSQSSDNLAYRIRVGSYRVSPGGGTQPIRDAVSQTKKKPAIEIFRMIRGPNGSVSYVPATEFSDPVPSDHRNLTLRVGSFGQSDQWASALDTFNGQSGGVMGAFINPLGTATGAVSGLADGLFGGDDSHAVWVFSGDGNKGVQNALTCNDQDNRGSRFVFTDNEPMVSVFKHGEFTDDDRIANINRVGSGGGYAAKNFDDTTLAEYLCSPKSKEEFDKLCQDELDLPSAACPSDERSLTDALTGLLPNLDPFASAIGKLRDIVGAFMGFIVEGLRSITDVGLANSGVIEAWKVMRDLVNILFVLILCALAFSTILRLDEKKYSIRALLPRLIFAIIGVNFSLLLMTILINSATVIGNPFLSGLNNILDQNPASNVDSLASIGGAGQQVVLLLASITVSIVLLMLLLLFVVRIVMLWVLTALAPFAFLFSVMPFSRSLSSQWLKQSIKWVYMAPVSFAILWMGSLFLSAADSFGATILSILIFIGVVIAAVLIPLRLGGEVMQKAFGGGKALGKGLGKFGGKAAVGAVLSKGKGSPASWSRTGTQALAQRKAMQEQQAQVDAAKGLQGVSERLSGNAVGERFAGALTGGNASAIATQHAATIDKYANELAKNKNVGPSQLMMISGNKNQDLRDAGVPELTSLADTVEGRQAAGMLLAQQGVLTQGFLYNDLNEEQRKEQFAAGNNKLMWKQDPAMAAIDRNGKASPGSLEIAAAGMASADAPDGQNMKFKGIHEGLTQTRNPERRKASQTVIKSIQPAQIDAWLDHENPRTFVAEDVERNSLLKALNHEKRSLSPRQLSALQKKISDLQGTDFEF